MCKRCGESVDHLLLHCPIAYEMWSMIFCLFGICWVILRGVVDLLDCWSCNFRRHHNIVIWRIVPHCLIWCFVLPHFSCISLPVLLDLCNLVS